MEQLIRKALIEAAPTLFGTAISDTLIQFQITRRDMEGDLTLVVFPFVKILRCAPQEAGEKLKNWIEQNIEGVSHCNVVSGFLNIVFTNAFWLEQLNQMQAQPNYGLAPTLSLRSWWNTPRPIPISLYT